MDSIVESSNRKYCFGSRTVGPNRSAAQRTEVFHSIVNAIEFTLNRTRFRRICFGRTWFSVSHRAAFSQNDYDDDDDRKQNISPIAANSLTMHRILLHQSERERKEKDKKQCGNGKCLWSKREIINGHNQIAFKIWIESEHDSRTTKRMNKYAVVVAERRDRAEAAVCSAQRQQQQNKCHFCCMCYTIKSTLLFFCVRARDEEICPFRYLHTHTQLRTSNRTPESSQTKRKF